MTLQLLLPRMNPLTRWQDFILPVGIISSVLVILVPLPDLTYQALRALWRKHRHPRLLFPNPVGSPERIRRATTHMDRGGTQAAMKTVVARCGMNKKSRSTRCDTVSPPICLSRD